MLTFQDLKEYDIKDIDINKIINQLKMRKDILANIVIILAVLFMAMKISGYIQKEKETLIQEINELSQKEKAVKKMNATEKDLNSIRTSLPQGPETVDDLIGKINQLATANNIQISDYTPQRSRETEFFYPIQMQLVVRADSYEQIGYFIYDLENANINLRVDNFEMGSSSTRRSSYFSFTDPPGEDKITANINIVAINFKEGQP